MIDIGFLCCFYTSSKSNWERSAKGSPLDGSIQYNRFSFHTEKELNPFIVFSLPSKVLINSIRVNFRDEYKINSLPMRVDCYSGNEVVKNLLIEENYDSPFFEFFLNERVDSIKITTTGYKSLDFSSINLFVDLDEMVKCSNIAELDSIIYCHSSFYGLGGKLAVLATSLGYLGENTHINNIFCDKGLDGLVSYPKPYCDDKDVKLAEFIKKYASESVSSYIFGGSYKSEKNISRYLPMPGGHLERQKFTFITRDAVDSFSYKGESDIKVKQRLYKRIIPSSEVFDFFYKLRDDNPIEEGEKCIGVHLRHGNGELYLSKGKDINIWGVKPPCFNEFFSRIDHILLKDSAVKKIFIASDSPSVKKVFEKKYKDLLEIVFVSYNTQNVGCGCNHTDSVFSDYMERKDINLLSDDKTSFSEMIFLSKCDYLIGGESYFYNAIVGFSSLCDDQIYKIENKDRYSRLRFEFYPVAKKKDSVLYDSFLQYIDYLDGIFIANIDGFLHVNYFDIELLRLSEGDEWRESVFCKLNKLLVSYRGY